MGSETEGRVDGQLQWLQWRGREGSSEWEVPVGSRRGPEHSQLRSRWE